MAWVKGGWKLVKATDSSMIHSLLLLFSSVVSITCPETSFECYAKINLNSSNLQNRNQNLKILVINNSYQWVLPWICRTCRTMFERNSPSLSWSCQKVSERSFFYRPRKNMNLHYAPIIFQDREADRTHYDILAEVTIYSCLRGCSCITSRLS